MTYEHQMAHVSFSIYQDVEPPEFWTNYFSIQPDSVVVKGKQFVTPSGRLSSGVGRVGVWGIRSKPHIRSDLLEPHLRYLVERLALPRADLPELLRRTNAHMRFFCYWYNEIGDRVPDIPEDIRRMCEAQGTSIEIDEYR